MTHSRAFVQAQSSEIKNIYENYFTNINTFSLAKKNSVLLKRLQSEVKSDKNDPAFVGRAITEYCLSAFQLNSIDSCQKLVIDFLENKNKLRPFLIKTLLELSETYPHFEVSKILVKIINDFSAEISLDEKNELATMVKALLNHDDALLIYNQLEKEKTEDNFLQIKIKWQLARLTLIHGEEIKALQIAHEIVKLVPEKRRDDIFLASEIALFDFYSQKNSKETIFPKKEISAETIDKTMNFWILQNYAKLFLLQKKYDQGILLYSSYKNTNEKSNIARSIYYLDNYLMSILSDKINTNDFEAEVAQFFKSKKLDFEQNQYFLEFQRLKNLNLTRQYSKRSTNVTIWQKIICETTSFCI